MTFIDFSVLSTNLIVRILLSNVNITSRQYLPLNTMILCMLALQLTNQKIKHLYVYIYHNIVVLLNRCTNDLS